MHIRPFQPEDISAAASIAVSCFSDDELYNFTNPHKAQYPDDFRAHFVRRLRLRYWTPGYVFYVAVTDDGDQGHEEGGRVAGFAVWQRTGNSAEAMRWQQQSIRSCSQRTFPHVLWGKMAFFANEYCYRR